MEPGLQCGLQDRVSGRGLKTNRDVTAGWAQVSAHHLEAAAGGEGHSDAVPCAGHHSHAPSRLQGASWGLWPGPSPGSGSFPHRMAGGPGSIHQWGGFSLSPSKSGFGPFPMCPLRVGLTSYSPRIF